ncbi:hypothetical protein K32_44240 [Kaistia sp. 32K]|uniref:DUF2628 domain-containing protein n=1 Tax=Kaistia sp. 32K TaxID=2795690 RepID=UPI001916BC41|nr:DUF2628 domain-containing protein [Kaistia sp. 32K]BCP55807.1 hypothetical protein K32_44240 [Kaistia sp. 32K]
MTIYTVHAPPVSATGGLDEADRMIFVKDGFSWPAFFLPVLWMLYRRMWVVLAVYALYLVAIELSGRYLGAPTAAALGLLGALFLGLEGSSLLRWTLSRRRFTEAGVAEGRSRAEAEIRFFHRFAAASPVVPEAVPATARIARAAQPNASADIVGLFPTPGTAR